MDSLPIFYEDNIKKRFPHSTTTGEDDLCPICEENKVSIMLECYHFFCENCIVTWLFKKKNNCPLCRYDINLKKYTEENIEKKQWDLIDLDKSEYIKETNLVFERALSDIFL